MRTSTQQVDSIDAMVEEPSLELSPRAWGIVCALFALCSSVVTPFWSSLERLDDHNVDYRIPYSLSEDYWTYDRHVTRVAEDQEQHVLVLGDSVVWGEYVNRDGTLPHFLTEQSHRESEEPTRFLNIGVNGLFPLALEGLVGDHAGALQNQRVILHCNLLWMSNPEADLSTQKERRFNHEELVSQFMHDIPAYQAPLETRLSVVARRQFRVFDWNRHVQLVAFEGRSLPEWSMDRAQGKAKTARSGSARRLMLFPVETPSEPAEDPDRGPLSARHRPWFERGLKAQKMDWVDPYYSAQWPAFQRLVHQLGERGNRVFVVVGPLNRYMMDEQSAIEFEWWVERVSEWLSAESIPHAVPETLDSSLYGDASHPLTGGYRVLAGALFRDENFRDWLESN